MKFTRKILLLTSAPILALGIGGIAVALHSSNPKSVSLEQTSSVRHTDTSDETQTDSPSTESAPVQAPAKTTPTVQQTVAPVDNVQALKDEVAQNVGQKAVQNGVSDVDHQVSCADQRINQSGGYTQDNVNSLYAAYINLATPEHPNAYAYFDGTCRIIFENVGSV